MSSWCTDMLYKLGLVTLHIYPLLLSFVKVVFSSECTPANYGWVFMPVYDNLILNDDVFSIKNGVTTRGECSAKCGRESRCLSFFYNSDTLICQMHTVVFLDPTGTASQGTRYFRKPLDCYIGPTIGSLPRLFDSDGVSSSVGKKLETTCLVCQIHTEEITCLDQGNVVTMKTCKLPTTCAEMKKQDSGYGDGEYWLYPPTFGGEKAKIYCHGMSTSSPTEYVSLVTPNQGHYPALDNSGCNGERAAWHSKAGDTTFTKIRINTQTMEVNRNDFEFATSTNVLKEYGGASDCYQNHGSVRVCGPKGTFVINTVGTGLRVDQTIQWPKYGWMPWAIVSKSNDGLVVNLNCGGYCGGCRPDKPFVLHRYAAQEPGPSSANGILCN